MFLIHAWPCISDFLEFMYTKTFPHFLYYFAIYCNSQTNNKIKGITLEAIILIHPTPSFLLPFFLTLVAVEQDQLTQKYTLTQIFVVNSLDPRDKGINSKNFSQFVFTRNSQPEIENF